ncbi:MAG: hypothetical protein IJB69_07190 [Clostridia bacterium]|nr:hypothetical protein [Clostridia bacterium]
MSQNNNKNSGNGATIIGVLVVVFFVVVAILSCNSDSGIDVVHDPNGFMGYSDSFWEWLGDQ